MIGASSSHHGAAAPDTSSFLPILMVDVELSDPLPSIDPTAGGREHDRARVLVLLHGTPIGGFDVDLRAGPVPAADLAQRVWEGLRPRINAHLMADRLGRVETLTEEGLGRGDGA
ncbi:MAG TPA: hypothetical protein VKY26_13040, partial [Actinomycetota bacterium]|nr:hypothetical protein [Actinomycetota bacterium]